MLPGLSYDQGEPAKANKVTVNCSSNARQTNTHIFRLLKRTDMKQRYWNSSCFGNHDATKGFGIITLFVKQAFLNLRNFFFDFVNITPFASCKHSLLLLYYYCADL